MTTGWRGPRDGAGTLGAVFYELHVGTFTPEGTFAAATAHLDHLVALGVDVVEVMPVAAFPTDRGWGYDGVGLYAVHDAYGGPEGFAAFVDACHSRGLGVCLDVVHNHLGASGNYLARFGPYFTEAHHTPWGAAVNLDDDGAPEVRRFLVENALRWFRDFHVDALRLDAVHELKDDSPRHYLAQLSAEVAALGAELGRPLDLVAESDLNDAALATSLAEGGWGLTAQWDDDVHHALHVALTGEAQGYYADFAGSPDGPEHGPLEVLARVLTHGFLHDGTYSSFRGSTWGAPVDREHLDARRLLGYLQTHDQVGNRAVGERISALTDAAGQAAGAALYLLAPTTPMLFMGEEWAASTPWQFFTSFAEDWLADAVRDGRRAEFGSHGWSAEVPDPQDPATRDRSVLDWAEPAEPAHARMLAWYTDLVGLRRRLLGDGTHPPRRRRGRRSTTRPAGSWRGTRRAGGPGHAVVVTLADGRRRRSPCPTPGGCSSRGSPTPSRSAPARSHIVAVPFPWWSSAVGDPGTRLARGGGSAREGCESRGRCATAPPSAGRPPRGGRRDRRLGAGLPRRRHRPAAALGPRHRRRGALRASTSRPRTARSSSPRRCGPATSARSTPPSADGGLGAPGRGGHPGGDDDDAGAARPRVDRPRPPGRRRRAGRGGGPHRRTLAGGAAAGAAAGRGRVEVALPESAAEALGLAVGDTLPLTDLIDTEAPRTTVEVVGTFRPRSARDALWVDLPLGLSGVTRSDFTTYGPFVVAPGTFDGPLVGASTVVWRATADLSRVHVGDLGAEREAVLTATERLRRAVGLPVVEGEPGTREAPTVTVQSPAVRTDLPPRLDAAALVGDRIRVSLLTPTLLLVLLGAVALVGAAALLAALRDGETRLMRTRGASTPRLAAYALGDAVVVAVVGVAGTALLAPLLARVVGGEGASWSVGDLRDPTLWRTAGVLAALAVGVTVVTTLWVGRVRRGSRSRGRGLRVAAGSGLDLVLVAPGRPRRGPAAPVRRGRADHGRPPDDGRAGARRRRACRCSACGCCRSSPVWWPGGGCGAPVSRSPGADGSSRAVPRGRRAPCSSCSWPSRWARRPSGSRPPPVGRSPTSPPSTPAPRCAWCATWPGPGRAPRAPSSTRPSATPGGSPRSGAPASTSAS